MNLPNTTPTPNELFNGEMSKMKDTELRVVLIITRKTLGWEIDHKTGMRKKEDWISRSQLMKFASRGRNSVSEAIKNCVKRDWIEARNKKGEILDTPEKRRQIGRGGKIYYRLGKIFLGKTEAVQKEDSSLEKQSKKRTPKKGHQKEDTTKETLSTKKTPLQKNMSAGPTDWQIDKEIKKLLEDKRRHIQVVGVWIKKTKLAPENDKQMQSIIKRNVRAAALLEGYKNEDIRETIDAMRGTEYLTKFTLETCLKFIDALVAGKKKTGRKIKCWKEFKHRDGRVVMRPVYEELKGREAIKN